MVTGQSEAEKKRCDVDRYLDTREAIFLPSHTPLGSQGQTALTRSNLRSSLRELRSERGTPVLVFVSSNSAPL